MWDGKEGPSGRHGDSRGDGVSGARNDAGRAASVAGGGAGGRGPVPAGPRNDTGRAASVARGGAGGRGPVPAGPRSDAGRAASVAGVVLAAGASTRMGVPKPLLDAGGKTFAARLVDALARGGCDPVVVVGASGAGTLADEVVRSPGLLVVNPGGRGGQIGSLRAALDHLEGLADPPGAFAFTPVDNPSVAPATVRALVEAWRGSQASIVLPRYGEARGHPVVADMGMAGEFRAGGLREGARTVVRRDPGRVLEVEVADPGVADDLDTPERYRARFGGPRGPVAGAGGEGRARPRRSPETSA